MQSEPTSVIRTSPIPRPPTPPRGSSNGNAKLSFFDRILHKDPASYRSYNITPESSTESANHTPTGISRGKKVEWSEWTEYQEPPTLPTDSQSIPQRQPPCAEQKPVKSILKATTKLLPPHKYKDFATMLESIVQQLAGNDRSSKVDSYMLLSGVLKASNNIPDPDALRGKIGLLMQFIRRDCSATHSTGTPDTPLASQALVLLASLLYRPEIAELLTQEFMVFIVDHAIKTFENSGMSKDTVKYLMHVLAQLNFPDKIMNAERVGKLVTVLHNLNGDERLVKGKSIAIGRLDIYQTLLRQSMPHMLVNTEWLGDLFTSMLSDLKDVRTPAIAFGFEASLAFGTEGKVSRAFMDMFQSETESRPGAKFAYIYAQNLKKMIREKEQCASVPQIWSVSILFLRYRVQQFEQWAFMIPWLKIIQECFNCSDQQTKIEANYAWNRLIFAIRPDDKTSSKTISMLRTPLTDQLKRKDLRKSSKTRKAALGSVYNLLYYSLKPNSTSDELDLYWDAYAAQFVRALTPTNTSETSELVRQDLEEACKILKSLFDSTTPRIWNENRAVDSLETNSIAVEELPAIDPKWLRKSASNVFPILEPLLERLYWDLCDETNTISSVWKTYITSIASAAVKEIKVSNDAMACVARIFNFLYKVWHLGPNTLHSLQPPKLSQNFLASFENFILTAIEGLGPLPFTEKLLSMGNQHQFIVIATPSHRPGKSPGEIRSPLHHLFVLVSTPSPGLKYNGKFSQVVRRMLVPFFEARKSSKAQMELVKDLLRLLPSESTEQSRILWRILADFATTATDTRDESTAGSSGADEQPLGGDYRSVVKLLEVGIDLSPQEVLPGWQGLFEALVTSATLDAGDGGCAIAVIDPLARILLAKLVKGDENVSLSGLPYYHMLLSKATYPKDRQALDAARRKIWGTVSGGFKSPTFDPYNKLYEYVYHSLEVSYTALNEIQPYTHGDIISTITSLLARCPNVLLSAVLVKLQGGLVCWIQDDSVKLNGGAPLSQAVTSLWAAICSYISQIITLHGHSRILSDLESLICSGLESKHQSIANSAIALWNSSFGNCQERLEYPERVEKALLRLRPIADLQLPFFPESLLSEEPVDGGQPIHFAETQNDSTNFFSSTSSDLVMRKHHTPYLNPFPIDRLRQFTAQVLIEVPRSAPGKRSRDETPEINKRKSRKRDSTPRLRHDDSQIQFEPIVSSPGLDTVLDSQLLTDRQKEVKERQEAEAAMFPDLRSSPRSKDKMQKNTASDAELPFHRSSSSTKLRQTTSPSVERQATPTIVPGGDEDNFVASSPTPTRSLHEHLDISAPPSSPPEAVFKERLVEFTESCDDSNIPSSPPEQVQEVENDTTTSIDPSAQIDPYAIENNPLSTFESSPDQREEPELEAPSSLLESFNDEHGPVLTPMGVEHEQSARVLCDPETEKEEIEPPGTPTRVRDDTPSQQTPKTPNEVFVDAQSNPIFSEQQTVNEDVFEDALSSPRLNMRSAAPDQGSSPLSNLDQSSMLRLMSKFDERSSQANGQGSFVEREQNLRMQTRSSLSKNAGHARDSPSVRTRSQGDATPRMPSSIELDEAAVAIHEPAGSSDQIQKSSSLPSLIPETPGKIPLMAEDEEEDLQDLDPDSTIIVDIRGLNWVEATFAKRSTHRKGSSKKRRHEEVTEDAAGDQGEVLNTQDAKAEGPSPAKLPAKKRKVNRRSTRSSYLSLSQQTETSAEPEHVRSPSSVDLDAPIPTQDVEEVAAMTEEITSIAKAVKESEAAATAQTEEDIPMADDRQKEITQPTEKVPTSDENLKINDPSTDTPDASGMENVAETTFDESSWEGISDLAKAEDAPREEGAPADKEDMLDPIDSTTEMAALQGGTVSEKEVEVEVEVEREVEREVEGEVEGEAEIPTAQSMKSKLESLISDLASAVLTRGELHVFEDMFMDAKEMLYGAGRRGRDRE